MKKLFGGTASRAELYGIAAVVSLLVAGGAGAAVVAASNQSPVISDQGTTTTTTVDSSTTSTIPGDTTTTINQVFTPGTTTTTTTAPQQFWGVPAPTTVPPHTAVVPDVLGITYDQARQELLNLNIGPGSLMDVGCYGGTPNMIVRQSPPPGTTVIADWNPVTYTNSASVEIWVEDGSGC